MLKKMSLLVLFTTILVISSLGLPAQKASALYVNATPKTQTISNAVASASWTVGWGGGQSPYTLSFREDADKGSRTIVSGTNSTSHHYTQRYDLGAAASKIWKPQFRIVDYWGLMDADIDKTKVFLRALHLL